jgi:UDP-GlcNAc3NAcA epimerase
MKKIVTILGARPQFIKAATVSRRFQQLGMDERIIHTGQHFDNNMSSVFFEEMELPRPSYQLEIHSLSHAALTGRMMEALEPLLLKEKPDGVLVYGDTNSTLAGALTAAKLNLPVIHIEAGLRSFNKQMPEEDNEKTYSAFRQFKSETMLNDALSQLIPEIIEEITQSIFNDTAGKW